MDITPGPRRGPPATAVQAAKSCFEAFNSQLEHAVEDPRLMSLVMDQQARFSVWASNIRAFGSGRASLDHRLREAPDVRDIIVGLLDTLKQHLDGLVVSRPALNVEAHGTDAAVAAEAERPGVDGLDERIDDSLKQIAAQISLLHKFSNMIRKASRETKTPNAAKNFRILDEDGLDIEASLHAVFDHYIRDRFPELDDSMRKRLADSMILQRKRVLYRRSRYGTKTIKVPVVPAQPVSRGLEIEMAASASVVETAPTQPVQEAPEVAPVLPSRSTIASVTQTVTTLVADTFRKVSAPSVVSASRTVATNMHERLNYPPAPRGLVKLKYDQIRRQRLGNSGDSDALEAEDSAGRRDRDWAQAAAAVGEITCPYCFYALPVEDVTEPKRWQRHVLVDLDPYVCLFNDCDTCDELYSHSDAWLKHMAQHAVRWRCKAKSHAPFVTASRDEYFSHMKSKHPGKFTDDQLDMLAETNGRRTTRLFDTCPLCGEDKVDGKMEDHVIGHLRLLGLKALPTYEDVAPDGGSDGDGASQNPSNSGTRSTLLDDDWDTTSQDPKEDCLGPDPLPSKLPLTPGQINMTVLTMRSVVPHICSNGTDCFYYHKQLGFVNKLKRAHPEVENWWHSGGSRDSQPPDDIAEPRIYKLRDTQWDGILTSSDSFPTQTEDPILQNFATHSVQQTNQDALQQQPQQPDLSPRASWDSAQDFTVDHMDNSENMPDGFQEALARSEVYRRSRRGSDQSLRSSKSGQTGLSVPSSKLSLRAREARTTSRLAASRTTEQRADTSANRQNQALNQPATMGEPSTSVPPPRIGGTDPTLGELTDLRRKSYALLLDKALQDLKARLDDKKTYTIESLGTLSLHAVLQLAAPLKGPLSEAKLRPYYVYIFDDVLLACKEVSTKKKRSIFSIFPSSKPEPPPKLERRGRINMVNVTDVITLSKPGGPHLLQLWWMNDVQKAECTGLTFNDQETMQQWASALEARYKAAQARTPTDPVTSTSHMGAQSTAPIPTPEPVLGPTMPPRISNRKPMNPDVLDMADARPRRPQGMIDEPNILDQWDPTGLPEEPRPGMNEPNVLDQWIEQRKDPEQRVGESASNDKPGSSSPSPLIRIVVHIETASDCVFMITASENINYNKLILRIRANPGFQAVDRRVKASTWKLKYRDEDGDMIAIQTDEDVREAISSIQTYNNSINFYMTPYDSYGEVAEDFPPDAQFETHEEFDDYDVMSSDYPDTAGAGAWTRSLG